MKRFVQITFSMKLNACLIFTATMLISALVELVWGFPMVTPWRVIQYAGLSAVMGFLQYICYTDQILKKSSYFVRSLIFCPSILAVLVFFAVVFRWFPVGELSSWVIFLAIFLVIFFGLLLGFEIMFRVTGRKYTDLLTEKQKHS